jgi:hypothetical protein
MPLAPFTSGGGGGTFQYKVTADFLRLFRKPYRLSYGRIIMNYEHGEV